MKKYLSIIIFIITCNTCVAQYFGKPIDSVGIEIFKTKIMWWKEGYYIPYYGEKYIKKADISNWIIANNKFHTYIKSFNTDTVAKLLKNNPSLFLENQYYNYAMAPVFFTYIYDYHFSWLDSTDKTQNFYSLYLYDSIVLRNFIYELKYIKTPPHLPHQKKFLLAKIGNKQYFIAGDMYCNSLLSLPKFICLSPKEKEEYLYLKLYNYSPEAIHFKDEYLLDNILYYRFECEVDNEKKEVLISNINCDELYWLIGEKAVLVD